MGYLCGNRKTRTEESRDWGLFMPSYKCMLQSLANIAMRDEESLRIVQETVKNGICKFVGTDSMSPAKWEDNLVHQYRTPHQYLASADEAIEMMRGRLRVRAVTGEL